MSRLLNISVLAVAGVLFAFSACADAVAVGGGTADPCLSARDETELLACRTKVTAVQTREINAANAILLKRASDEPRLVAALRVSHQAWLRYRDAECRVETWESSTGSAAPAHLLYCQEKRNRARLAELRERVQSP
jgi:uncharacterized protein YecT (DUF1311 family)